MGDMVANVKENPALRKEFANLESRLNVINGVEDMRKKSVKRLMQELSFAKKDLNRATKERRELEKEISTFWQKHQAKAWRQYHKLIERAYPVLP